MSDYLSLFRREADARRLLARVARLFRSGRLGDDDAALVAELWRNHRALVRERARRNDPLLTQMVRLKAAHVDRAILLECRYRALREAHPRWQDKAIIAALVDEMRTHRTGPLGERAVRKALKLSRDCTPAGVERARAKAAARTSAVQ